MNIRIYMIDSDLGKEIKMPFALKVQIIIYDIHSILIYQSAI